MDLRNLWDDWTASGEAAAEHVRQQKALGMQEPAPFPAQLMAGMVHPLTHFNESGGDPIEQGIELGSFGISPFRGAIATARPLMTAEEQLWQRAQQGDIHATGQLTGEMWNRDLANIPPMTPDPLYPDTQIVAPRAEPEVRARPGYVEPDDDYITMAPVPKGLFEPPPPGGWGVKPSLPPDPSEIANFREGMDYLPPAGPEGYVPKAPDDLSQVPLDPSDPSYGGGLYWGDEPISNLDPTMGGAFPEGLSYEDWQAILSRMQATPPLPPRINPFGPRYGLPEGYPDGY
jgi:hypothetical protein